MESGLRDRNNLRFRKGCVMGRRSQWSPVLETGTMTPLTPPSSLATIWGLNEVRSWRTEQWLTATSWPAGSGMRLNEVRS